MDAYTNVESLHFNFDQQQNKIPILYIYNEQSGITIPIPIPPITPLSPPLGAIPPLPTNILGDLKPMRDDLSKRPIPQAVMVGLALGPNGRGGDGRGQPRCNPLWRGLEGPPTGRSARRGPGFRRPLLRQECDPQN
jgi:hypothetical protein